jgi:hypothetical protein
MSTVPDAAARARERIRRFGERQPDALRLARYASLAVSVDAALLRALRRELLRGSDAGLEADVWFSPLTESVSTEGFVLDADVAAQLRDELAAELTKDGRQHALETSISITRRMHRHWPESLRTEERATGLALRAQGAAAPGDDLETVLRGLVKAMTEDAARGMEIARWAQRALRRLPKVARETEAALLLALGAAERLGMPIRFTPGDRSAPLPASTSWILPAGSFSRTTEVGVRRHDEGIEFMDAAQAPLQVNVPLTSPLYLEISWQAGSDRAVQTVSVAPGRMVSIPATATDVRLRTLAGAEFALESVATGEGTGPDVGPIITTDYLARASVLVIDDTLPRNVRVRTGFFVSPDSILTIWPREAPVDDTLTTLPFRVQWQGQFLEGRVGADRRPSDAVLIRLEHPVPDAVILHPSQRSLEPGVMWHSLDLVAVPPRLLHGTVKRGVETRDDHPMTADSLAWLDVQTPLGSWEALNGAPLVIDGELAGQFLPGPTEAAARPYAVLEPWLLDVVRPLAPARPVFVSYAARDEYGKGLEMDEAPLERLIKALREARLTPILDTELPSGIDPLIDAMNGTEGAAFVWTPVSQRTPEGAHLQRLALAYRNWAQPDFRLAAFRFRGDPPEGTPRSLTALVYLNLDRATDAELRDYAAEFAGAVNRAAIDDETGFAAVRRRLEELLEKIHTDPALPWSQELSSGRVVARSTESVINQGLFADLPWAGWVPRLPLPEARELIDIGTMFSFPAQTHEPLRALVRGAPGRRAFALNAMPVNVAHAVIRRAWIGRTPPRAIVFRDQSWEGDLSKPELVLERVHLAIAGALDCSSTEAQWALRHVRAPLFLIFLTRPLPPAGYVQKLLEMMPSAFLLFMMGNDGTTQGAGDVVVELPRLAPGADGEFLTAYKQLEYLVTPQASERIETPSEPPAVSGPSSSPSSQVPRGKTSATSKARKRKRAPTTPRKSGAS